MASAGLAQLQATTNRFASKVGFAPIPVDGGMGILTQRAVSDTLKWVADGGNFFDSISSAMRGAALGLSSIVGTGITAMTSSGATAIMQQLTNINDTLTRTANELGLPAAAGSAPAPKPAASGSGPIVVNPVTGNAQLPNASKPATGALAAIGGRLGLTTVQTVLFLGILGGVGVLAVKRMRG